MTYLLILKVQVGFHFLNKHDFADTVDNWGSSHRLTGSKRPLISSQFLKFSPSDGGIDRLTSCMDRKPMMLELLQKVLLLLGFSSQQDWFYALYATLQWEPFVWSSLPARIPKISTAPNDNGRGSRLPALCLLPLILQSTRFVDMYKLIISASLFCCGYKVVSKVVGTLSLIIGSNNKMIHKSAAYIVGAIFVHQPQCTRSATVMIKASRFIFPQKPADQALEHLSHKMLPGWSFVVSM